MRENKSNVYKSVLLSKEQRKSWVLAGERKILVIPNPEVISTKNLLTQEINLYSVCTRETMTIFCPIPLEAYNLIESSNTLFLLLGGSSIYKEQSVKLGIKNIEFIPTTPARKYS